ncbi:hypothetical protein GGR89_000017 [Sphingomonas trueperi]|uniref:MmyB-like transcription regulator ligand binding domain-containing protein n=1 Tax=Sphingomonas trueperi TaxID=53317 RepID=A0A7X5XVE6_9SPHN|nr:hypothetical protein [Sphingomonas trueperi]
MLERIASGLMLTAPEREHLFVLGLGRPPAIKIRGSDEVTPRLQRVLDAMPTSPAIIKTATWDVVAWNAAASAVLTDYSLLPREHRNILRLVFTNSKVTAAQEDWRSRTAMSWAPFGRTRCAPALRPRSPGWSRSCRG